MLSSQFVVEICVVKPNFKKKNVSYLSTGSYSVDLTPMMLANTWSVYSPRVKQNLVQVAKRIRRSSHTKKGTWLSVASMTQKEAEWIIIS